MSKTEKNLIDIFASTAYKLFNELNRGRFQSARTTLSRLNNNYERDLFKNSKILKIAVGNSGFDRMQTNFNFEGMGSPLDDALIKRYATKDRAISGLADFIATTKRRIPKPRKTKPVKLPTFRPEPVEVKPKIRDFDKPIEFPSFSKNTTTAVPPKSVMISRPRKATSGPLKPLLPELNQLNETFNTPPLTQKKPEISITSIPASRPLSPSKPQKSARKTPNLPNIAPSEITKHQSLKAKGGYSSRAILTRITHTSPLRKDIPASIDTATRVKRKIRETNKPETEQITQKTPPFKPMAIKKSPLLSPEAVKKESVELKHIENPDKYKKQLGDTDLHHLARYGLVRSLTKMLSEQSNCNDFVTLNRSNLEFESPIHLAIKNDHNQAANLIIDAISSKKTLSNILNQKDSSDQTILDIAITKGNKELIDKLESLGARRNITQEITTVTRSKVGSDIFKDMEARTNPLFEGKSRESFESSRAKIDKPNTSISSKSREAGARRLGSIFAMPNPTRSM